MIAMARRVGACHAVGTAGGGTPAVERLAERRARQVVNRLRFCRAALKRNRRGPAPRTAACRDSAFTR